MVIKNSEIAAAFFQLADSLEADNSNPYRIRAYRRAARIIDNYKKEFSELVAAKADLTKIRGIGKVIANQIVNIVHKRELPLEYYLRINKERQANKEKEDNKNKKNKTNYKSTKAERKNLIAKSIKKKPKEFRLFHAVPAIEALVVKLKLVPSVKEVIATGTYRRRKELIDQITIMILSNKPKLVIEHFLNFSELTKVYRQEKTEIDVKLHMGLDIVVKVRPQKYYWQEVFLNTGSEEHLNALDEWLKYKRHRKETAIRIIEQTEDREHKDKKKPSVINNEQQIYELLELDYIEPELRENQGEIEAAYQHKLPNLITLSQIKGDLHCHTNATDGWDTLETMVKSATEKGYEYVAITDHSQRLRIANGLDKKRLLAQIKIIDKLNNKLQKENIQIRVLKSTEMDILEDGSLDFPNDLLKELDFTVCSIHSRFRIPKEKQTERLLRAMDNPYFNILGHATGRLIKSREPYEIYIKKIFKAAKERNCFIELNSQPYRLDINNLYCQLAKKMGVKISLSSDAHSTRELHYMKYGIYEARRGWLEAKDIINTRSLKDLLQLFIKK